MPVITSWTSTANGFLRCGRDRTHADTHPRAVLADHGPLTPVGGDPPDPPAATAIRVDPARRYQRVLGFGAALTDSSAWLLENALPPAARQRLLVRLFGDGPGLHLDLVRLTIGASDFSRRRYSLDDVPSGQADPELRHFSIAHEREAIIPLARAILRINPHVRFIASSWSAPAWMKDNGSLIGGHLLPSFDSTFARYLAKYVAAMQDTGVPIYGLSVQNEPHLSPTTYPGMQMGAAQRARIIGQYLGPLLQQRHLHTMILGWDHNWSHPEEPIRVLSDPAAARFIGAVAWHCYAGNATAQALVHAKFPRPMTLISECSVGTWDRDTQFLWYAQQVLLEGLRNFANGVVYWNIALNPRHGPHDGGCSGCDPLVTIAARPLRVQDTDTFYATAQFSRFIPPGSVRIYADSSNRQVGVVAFSRPSGQTVLVAVNHSSGSMPVSIGESDITWLRYLPPASVTTFVFGPLGSDGDASAAVAGGHSRTAPVGMEMEVTR